VDSLEACPILGGQIVLEQVAELRRANH